MAKIIEFIKAHIWIPIIIAGWLLIYGIWTIITKHPVTVILIVISGGLIYLAYYLNKKK